MEHKNPNDAYEYWLDCREGDPYAETNRASCGDESHKKAFIAGWRFGCKFSFELAQKQQWQRWLNRQKGKP